MSLEYFIRDDYDSFYLVFDCDTGIFFYSRKLDSFHSSGGFYCFNRSELLGKLTKVIEYD